MLMVPCPPCVNSRAAAQLGRFEQDATRAAGHGQAQRRQLGALAHAVQQPRAQVFLQQADAAAQRGLREMQTLGRAAERTGLGHGQQVLKLLEVHVQV